jgi:hypothetical protein
MLPSREQILSNDQKNGQEPDLELSPENIRILPCLIRGLLPSRDSPYFVIMSKFLLCFLYLSAACMSVSPGSICPPGGTHVEGNVRICRARRVSRT